MPSTSSRRRTARRSCGAVGALGVLGALALTGLGAAPAGAADAGPGLVLGEITPSVGLDPHDVFGVQVPFTNTGSAALDKVWIAYNLSHGLGPAAELPVNCERYDIRGDDGGPTTSVVQCEFDQTIEPGVLYAPMETLGLRALDSALYDRVGVQVANRAPGPGDDTTPPVRGTAPAEPLVEVPGTPAPPGSAENEDWDSATVEVTARNTADFRAVGARLKGRVGDTVTFKVGLTNAGPAWVWGNPRHRLAHFRVTLPQGTTVTHAFCVKLKARTYDCPTGTNWLYENDGDTYDFTLRIDRAVPGARGSVTITGQARPFDHVKSDDTAPILLDSPPPTSTPRPRPAPPPGRRPAPPARPRRAATSLRPKASWPPPVPTPRSRWPPRPARSSSARAPYLAAHRRTARRR